MLLEHIGWHEAAALIHASVEKTLAAKKVTVDLASQINGSTQVGCKEFGRDPAGQPVTPRFSEHSRRAATMRRGPPLRFAGQYSPCPVLTRIPLLATLVHGGNSFFRPGPKVRFPPGPCPPLIARPATRRRPSGFPPPASPGPYTPQDPQQGVESCLNIHLKSLKPASAPSATARTACSPPWWTAAWKSASPIPVPRRCTSSPPWTASPACAEVSSACSRAWPRARPTVTPG